MLTLWGRKHRYCDHIHRREFLRVGALGLGGLGLAELLRWEAQGAEPARKKSVIYITLNGGPSHIDMYDLKPEAPDEYRGPFRPIATRLPGVRICEHMPLQAGMMDQLALLRGIRSVENDHFLSEVFTGLPRTAGHRPAFGSIVSRFAKDDAGPLPTYVSLDRPATDEFDFQKPYYAGAAHRPFRPFGEGLEDLKLSKEVTPARLGDRRQLLESFDNLRRDIDQRGEFEGMDKFGVQALEMITSDKVRDAFDLSKEPDRVIAAYGRGGKFTHQTVKTILYDWDTKKFVLARRLVEAGARVVTLSVPAWDHHEGPTSDIFLSLRHMLPPLDRSLVALINDLRERGLEKDVLVVVLGEFGRTPKIGQPGPGRNHHAAAGCAVLFGGGLKMGQVIGQTDSRAERSKTGKINFQNIMATIYHVLGIEPSLQLTDFNGRPQYVLEDREPIAELL
jgi:hypothetical protein